MADAALRRTVVVSTTAWLEPQPTAARLVFRGNAAACAGAAVAFGLALPEMACRATTDGTRAALWLGPDEQLLLAPDGEIETLEAAFARALSGQAYSLVDVSHRQLGFTVHGPRAEWLLEAQCPLPLNLRDFPVGMCTRTVFGKAEIVLWRPAEQVFRLEVWRSFANYVVELLQEIARESDT